MTTSVEKLQADITASIYNPASIQKAALSMLKEISNGSIEIVDPTNPFVFLMEASAVMTAASVAQNEANTRKQYAFAAQNSEDLYPHMSDKDYVDRFAIPTSVDIMMFFDKQELINSLVTDPDTGIKKVVIPRNTTFTVAETTFSIQYPIEIRQMAHGGLQVVWDVSQTSPLKTLSTNVIDWRVAKLVDASDKIAFKVRTDQFSIVSRTGALNLSTSFSTDIDLTDDYYFTRVWGKLADGTYKEITTTHTDAVYDALSPTAVLKVVDKRVTVKIPQIYLTTGQIPLSIRIDVYQTKGDIRMPLLNYPPTAWVAKFLALDTNDATVYTAPLSAMRTILIASDGTASGGASALAFTDLRDRVIRNAVGAVDLPITNVQILSKLNRAGYTVVKNIDNITNRTFLAARSVPNPTNPELITAASAGIVTLSTKLAQIVLQNTVVDNGDIITIKPETLYRSVSGVLQLVPDTDVAALLSLPADQRALAVTIGKYYYSPFHYVLDTTLDQFAVRAYYLNGPTIPAKSFIGENDTTGLQVSTGQYEVIRTTTGYKLQVITTSSKAYQDLDDADCTAQLGFTPKGETSMAYVQGVQVAKTNGERIYEFDLTTNYRINSHDQIFLTNFTMFDETPRQVACEMLESFELFYATDATMPSSWTLNAIDTALGLFQLPPSTVGITHESFSIRLGYRLDYLWARSRSVVSDQNYERWAVDVAAVYQEDVFEYYPGTLSIFRVNLDNTLTYNKVHSAGDPILDDASVPIIRHYKGDIKLDNDGNPIVISGRQMLRQIDLMLVEGSYYFATNQVASDYRQTIVDEVVNWLINDLPNMGSNLLEETDLFYYPTTTIGPVNVMFGAGLTTTIEAGQGFHVKLYVRNNVYINEELKASLVRNTIATINAGLTVSTVSMSDIVDALRTQYKDDVINVEITGLGPDGTLSVVTMLDDSRRLMLRKKLVARPDDSLSVAEDVVIDFIRHERDSNIVQ
jgi:hypothetical protein